MEHNMGIVTNILKDEYERLKRLEAQYLQQLKTFPKGAISKRQRSGTFYLYLIFRENKKVITRYVGKFDSNKAKKVIRQVEERKKVEEKLKKVQADLKELKRSLK